MPVRCAVCVFVLLLLLACLNKSHSIKRGLLSSWTDDWRALEWNIGQLGLVHRIEEQLANIMKWVSYWRGFTWVQVDLWWRRKPSNWEGVTWTVIMNVTVGRIIRKEEGEFSERANDLICEAIPVLVSWISFSADDDADGMGLLFFLFLCCWWSWWGSKKVMLNLINSPFSASSASSLPESSAMDQIFFSPSNGVPSESKLSTYLVI